MTSLINSQDSTAPNGLSKPASRTYGATVWMDVRNAAVCPAVDAYRQSLATPNPLPKPAPNADCPATFGNTDIFGGQFTG